MANLFCYCAGIIMLVPVLIFDLCIKVTCAIYYILYIAFMSFCNPKKARSCKNDYDYKNTAFGWKFYFSEKVINFYFKD